MGCFSALKPRKRKSRTSSNLNSIQRPPISTETTPVRLPEPHQHQTTPSLQSAPPSFRNRVNTPPSQNSIPNRTRALSAPSFLIDPETNQNPNQNNNYNDYTNNNYYNNALPLPEPREQKDSVKGHFGNLGSFKGVDYSGPLPLPPLGDTGLRNFSYDELAIGCQNFTNCVSDGVYEGIFSDDFGTGKKIEATIIRLANSSSQNLKDFISEVNTLSNLHHSNLCKIIGFHISNNERMIVYERLHHGRLHRVLHSRSGAPSIDWNTRMKVALNAAKGLTFLHEEGPFQAMYDEFSTENIQIDKDFTAKLSGYGCVTHSDISNSSSTTATETLEKCVLTPKSNVYSFGILLLELITGRKNLDPKYPKEERNLVKYSKTFLLDDCRLSLILDPRIKGRFPPKAARIIADVIIRCLSKDSKERPTMRGIVDLLGNVCDMKYLGRYPLQDPGKIMLKSPSFNGIVIPAPLPPPRSYNSMIVT